jgi:hypothetical protein
MAEPPPVIWLQNNVSAFFAGKYRQPANLFKWDSNVRAAFALGPPARWASLGDELNRQPWMASVHIMIDANSADWMKASTVGQITEYLFALFASHRRFVKRLAKADDLEALLATKVVDAA